jgi:hypothetical protein
LYFESSSACWKEGPLAPGGGWKEDGIFEGSIKEAADWGVRCGGGTCEGRALRISRSSKSSSTSEMSPSEGSLSDTSSMRACDIVEGVALFCAQDVVGL